MRNTILSRKWWEFSLMRCVKTMCQVAVATIGTTALLSQVDWLAVLSTTVLAGILSLLTSVAGLPELKEE